MKSTSYNNNNNNNSINNNHNKSELMAMALKHLTDAVSINYEYI